MSLHLYLYIYMHIIYVFNTRVHSKLRSVASLQLGPVKPHRISIFTWFLVLVLGLILTFGTDNVDCQNLFLLSIHTANRAP
jgi:hypothetical protein